MKQAIVIGSTTKTKHWLENCLNSFGDYRGYPIMVMVNNDWEIGKIKWVLEYTNLDEFFLLHDTVEIKDPILFDIAFKTNAGKSFALSGSPAYMGMYLGKYRREVLSQIEIPSVATKKEAVDQEIAFNQRYAEKEQNKEMIEQPLNNTNIFEDKFGRTNMVLENFYIKKYKGTWSYDQVPKL